MKVNIVRAWKDSSYRASLSNEELALLPENPVGHFALTDEELKAVYGGQAHTPTGSIGFTANCSQSQGGFGSCNEQESFSFISTFC